ncbi:MAG: hypothetical protein IT369_05090 [Candidatus Latescibacteria bacterium]|nr:hypothetical protein [Candidatus Latescibacterota bacterium]
MGWRLIAAIWFLAVPLRAGAQEVLLSLDARSSRLSLFETGALRTAWSTPVLVRPEGACGVAFSGYSAYFVDATDTDQLIYELNPLDGTVWNTLPAPAAGIDGLAFDQGVLFAQGFAEDRIYRLEPITGAVLGTLEPGVDLVGGLAAGAGRLFASRLRPAALFELDPRSGQVLRELPTTAQLPSGLAFAGGRLYVGDYQQNRVISHPEGGAAEEVLALNVGKVAGLDGGNWSGAVPYRIALEQVSEEALADGRVEFGVRAALVDGSGRLLSGNQRSQLEFVLLGAGELASDPAQIVTGGQVRVMVRLPAGANTRLEARLSGLEPGSLLLRAVPRITQIEVQLTPSPTDSSLLQVEAHLWDAQGQPALEDTGMVQFSVAWGNGVLVGAPAVLAQEAQAGTWVRHLGGRGQLAVEARVRALRGRGTWVRLPNLPAPAPPGGLATTTQRVGSADQSLPAPPTGLQASLQEGWVRLQWQLSADEGARHWFPYGEGLVAESSFRGYWVFRSTNGGLYVLLGRVAGGTGAYADSVGEEPAIYRYRVLAEEGENLGEEVMAVGSAADQLRTVVVGRGVPVDAGGQPVAGLFNDDLVVDFDDFFLFADHFGANRERDEEFDGRFDLDGDGRVGFEDFFRFADNFGKVVAGYQ